MQHNIKHIIHFQFELLVACLFLAGGLKKTHLGNLSPQIITHYTPDDAIYNSHLCLLPPSRSYDIHLLSPFPHLPDGLLLM